MAIGLSMNILRAGDKSPAQERFLKTSAGDLLPALRFLGGLHNFCNFVIIFSLIKPRYVKERHILQIRKRSHTTKKRVAEIAYL